MAEKLTVLIPCKNERSNILPCINSARAVADEILIADSGSTDGTLEVVKADNDCRLIQREYVDSGNFKNWAMPQARHAWIFVLDADERITPELSDEIRKVLSDRPAQDGFCVYRRNYFMGRPVRHTSWGRDKVVRLVRRDVGRYREYTDHTEIDLPASQLGVLKHRLTHYTCWNYDLYLKKMHRYTQQQADVWWQEGRRPSRLRLYCHGPLRFLREYVLLRGFLDGPVGLQVSALSAFYSFMKQARLWHRYHALTQADLESVPVPGESRLAALSSAATVAGGPSEMGRRQDEVSGRLEARAGCR